LRPTWPIDPIARTLEVFALEGGRWVLLDVQQDAALVRAAPFDAVELELSVLWEEAEGDDDEG
jgi:hypothetical protein